MTKKSYVLVTAFSIGFVAASEAVDGGGEFLQDAPLLLPMFDKWDFSQAKSLPHQTSTRTLFENVKFNGEPYSVIMQSLRGMMIPVQKNVTVHPPLPLVGLRFFSHSPQPAAPTTRR